MILLIIFIVWFLITATILLLYFKIATPEQIERDCLQAEVYHLGHWEKFEEYLLAEIKLNKIKKLFKKKEYYKIPENFYEPLITQEDIDKDLHLDKLNESLKNGFNEPKTKN
jgi:hypothetical protein